MAAGFGILGLSPAGFWALTPREFASAVRGRLGGGGCDGPPTRVVMAELMHRFPDKDD